MRIGAAVRNLCTTPVCQGRGSISEAAKASIISYTVPSLHRRRFLRLTASGASVIIPSRSARGRFRPAQTLRRDFEMVKRPWATL